MSTKSTGGAVARITTGKRFRIPPHMAKILGIEEGDYVVIRKVADGLSVEKLNL